MLICVRNRCAHWSLRLNPGTVDYMSNLSTNSRHFLRAAARKQDQSKAQRLFLVSQAREDAKTAKTAKEKHAAAEKCKKQAADQIEMLNEFKPILSLKKLKSMTIDGDKGPMDRKTTDVALENWRRCQHSERVPLIPQGESLGNYGSGGLETPSRGSKAED